MNNLVVISKHIIIVIILLTLVACGNRKPEPIIEESTTKPELPKYEPSKYASIGDTIFINSLQITLDSVFVRVPDLGENSAMLQIYGKDNQEMLNVYVKITNTSKETKEIPYVDQIEEIRKKIGVNSVRIRKSDNQNDLGFRLGSRLFVNTKKNQFVVSVKPGQTISGLYRMGYKPYQFTAISFWYYNDDEIESESQMMTMLVKMSKAYKVEKKPVFHILQKDAQINDVGFDITDLRGK